MLDHLYFLSLYHLLDLSFTYLFPCWGGVELLQEVTVTDELLRVLVESLGVLVLVDDASLSDYFLKIFILDAFLWWSLILGVCVREVFKQRRRHFMWRKKSKNPSQHCSIAFAESGLATPSITANEPSFLLHLLVAFLEFVQRNPFLIPTTTHPLIAVPIPNS